MFKHAQLESVKVWLIDPQYASLPRYVRIQRAIRQMILDAVLDVGKPLPASRVLATSLNVSRDTVEMAYSQLHAEGFIERHVGRGSVVSKKAQHLPKRSAYKSVATENCLSQRGKALFENGGVRDYNVPRPFAPGVPETRRFPLHLWERLQRQVFKEYGSQALWHSPPQGVESLRHAIADYVNLERGAHATADRVLVLTSSQQAMSLCAQVLLDIGDEIFIEDPVYHGARKAFTAAGLNCVAIPLDEDGILFEPLHDPKHRAKVVFLTPSHQYPTGVTLSLDRRLAIIEWAQQRQGWIIEDDYDSEFHYAGKPMACVQGLDSHQRTIYIGTFTKSLFPGLRIGYMVLPTPLVKPMTVARTLLDGHSAPIAQLTLARFIQGGHFGAYVRTMRSLYAERLSILVQLLQQHLHAFVTPIIPAGGMQLPCILHCNIAEHVFIEHAREVGIELLGLSTLHSLKPNQTGFLMGFAAYSPTEMEQAIEKLAVIFNRLSR